MPHSISDDSRASRFSRSLPILFILTSLPVHAASVSLFDQFLSPTQSCSEGGPVATCTLSGTESLPYAGSIVSATMTATDGATLATVITSSTLDGNSTAMGSATLGGTQVFSGGTGTGYAEYLLSWNVGVFSSDYTMASITGDGLNLRWAGGTIDANGEFWSQPIQMTWGLPFTYGGVDMTGYSGNDFADCCGDVELRAQVLGWRTFDTDPVLEPSSTLPLGILMGLLSVVAWRTRRIANAEY